jgi:hypothetical protein
VACLLLGGVALMVLPTMVVGNELLILGVVALVVGGWFLAHLHGHLRGVVTASTEESAATPNGPTLLQLPPIDASPALWYCRLQWVKNEPANNQFSPCRQSLAWKPNPLRALALAALMLARVLNLPRLGEFIYWRS